MQDGTRHTLNIPSLPHVRGNGSLPLTMRIEIICTGDEVLTGATVNSNFSHISQRLYDVGLNVRWGTTVGDDRQTLL